MSFPKTDLTNAFITRSLALLGTSGAKYATQDPSKIQVETNLHCIKRGLQTLNAEQFTILKGLVRTALEIKPKEKGLLKSLWERFINWYQGHSWLNEESTADAGRQNATRMHEELIETIRVVGQIYGIPDNASLQTQSQPGPDSKKALKWAKRIAPLFTQEAFRKRWLPDEAIPAAILAANESTVYVRDLHKNAIASVQAIQTEWKLLTQCLSLRSGDSMITPAEAKASMERISDNLDELTKCLGKKSGFGMYLQEPLAGFIAENEKMLGFVQEMYEESVGKRENGSDFLKTSRLYASLLPQEHAGLKRFLMEYIKDHAQSEKVTPRLPTGRLVSDLQFAIAEFNEMLLTAEAMPDKSIQERVERLVEAPAETNGRRVRILANGEYDIISRLRRNYKRTELDRFLFGSAGEPEGREGSVSVLSFTSKRPMEEKDSGAVNLQEMESDTDDGQGLIVMSERGWERQ